MAIDLKLIDFDAFKKRKDEEQARANLTPALDANPDLLTASENTGHPTEVIEQNRAEIDKEIAFDNVGFDAMSQRSSKVTEYITDINNAILAQDDFSVLNSSGGGVGVFFAIVVIILVFIVSKFNFKRLVPRVPSNSGAFISGWGIWCFCVFTYSTLFYEDLEYQVWFTLPPLCVLAMIVWFKRFVSRNNWVKH